MATLTISEQIEDQIGGFDNGPPVGFVMTIGANRQEYVLFDRYFTSIEGVDFLRLCWSSHCAVCGAPMLAITETRFKGLGRSCTAHWGQYSDPHTHMAREEREAQRDFKLDIVARDRPDGNGQRLELVEVYPDMPLLKEIRVKLHDKLGPVERLVLDVIEQDYPTESRVRYEDFVASVVARMRSKDAVRDTRRQRVTRSIEGLTRGRNALLAVVNGFVLFYLDDQISELI